MSPDCLSCGCDHFKSGSREKSLTLLRKLHLIFEKKKNWGERENEREKEGD